MYHCATRYQDDIVLLLIRIIVKELVQHLTPNHPVATEGENSPLAIILIVPKEPFF